MERSIWTVAEAKAKLSEVIEQAQSRGPQAITRRGHKTAVAVSFEEWERKTKRAGNLAEFFAASPLRGSGLVVERSKQKPARNRASETLPRSWNLHFGTSRRYLAPEG